jgi:glycosyltransferase involved in cell wall biosynthesis
MSVAILHYSCYPVIGGVETVIQAHAKLFAKNGYPVKLIVGAGKQFDKRIPVIVIPEMRALHLVDKAIHAELGRGNISNRFKKLEALLYKKLKHELSRTTICIPHNILTMHFNLALTSALTRIINESSGKEKQKRFISWEHDATFLDPHYRKEWKDAYPWNLLSQITKGAKQVTISNLRKRKLTRLFKLKSRDITVVPDGIDPADFLRLSPTASSLIEKLNLSSYDFVFFYPTRMVRRKNIELAIKLTSEVNLKGKKTCLLITSPPDPHNKDSILYYESLKKLAGKLRIKDRVIFLSEQKGAGTKIRINDRLLRDIYLFSDMLLFPSKAEGFGIPILESGICHLPVACSKIAPLTEIGGEDMLYLDLDDNAGKMAGKIIGYLDKSLTLRLHKKVMRDYTWESIFTNKIIPLIH